MSGPSDYKPHYDWSPVLREKVKKVLAAQGLEAARKFLLEKGVHGSSESFTFTSLNDLVDIDIRLGHIDEAYSLLADRIKWGSRDEEMLARASAVACLKGKLFEGQAAFVRRNLHSVYSDSPPVPDPSFKDLHPVQQVLVNSFVEIASEEYDHYNNALAAFYFKRALDLDSGNVDAALGFGECLRADDVQCNDAAYHIRFLESPEKNRQVALKALDRIKSEPMSDRARLTMRLILPRLANASNVLGTRQNAAP